MARPPRPTKKPDAQADPPTHEAQAIEALRARAAAGDIKAIRALTDGTLDRLRALATPQAPDSAAEIDHNQVVTRHTVQCPMCSNSIRLIVTDGRPSTAADDDGRKHHLDPQYNAYLREMSKARKAEPTYDQWRSRRGLPPATGGPPL